MIFWESDLNFVTVLLDAINLGHLLLQKQNGAGDRRVHAATILIVEGFQYSNRKLSKAKIIPLQSQITTPDLTVNYSTAGSVCAACDKHSKRIVDGEHLLLVHTTYKGQV